MHLLYAFLFLQGDPCEPCPVVSSDSTGNTVAFQSKQGPKGEPGAPGKGEQGPPVSSFSKPTPQTASVYHKKLKTVSHV